MRIESWRWRNAALAMGFCLLCALRAHAVLAAAAPAALPATAPPPADYKVGPGDLLRVNVFGSPELATDARVSQSGAITVSLIGSVQVAGLSTGEAEKLLAKRFVDGGFLRQPQISVLVVEYESQKINVLGHVVKPGQYALRASATVLDVLADAGGVIANSAGDTATLMRSDGTKRDIDLDALFSGDQAQNVTVAGGDRLFVPRAEQFYVYGQVQKPGVYRLERNMTVSRAITAGGGLTARGTERRAIVKRRDASGAEKEYSVKPTDVLKADDVLFIKESLF